ncbi:MAG: type II toxin-antitoxin system Phd/YefM family antitoxin [Pseudomonadota bacterium]|nr:type II toxin-antitoxin system Phd/YefM family antitoxin [Pseudomonadota bacterium]
MKWSIAQARQHFSQLLKATRQEPQPIYNRDRLVAAVVDAETFEQFKAWHDQQKQRTVGAAFEELRRLCQEENYTLEIPPRLDRPDPFAETLDEFPG